MKNVKKMLAAALAAAVLCGGSLAASADEYLFGFSGLSNATLDVTTDIGGTTNYVAVDQGWWSTVTGHSQSNQNYIVGELPNFQSGEFRNYFCFGLAIPAGETVTAVTLNVVREFGLSDSGQTTHHLSFFDVFFDVGQLDVDSGPNAAIFNDLGSGVLYGEYDVTVNGNPAEVLQFALNGDAIGAINDGPLTNFCIGGTLEPGGGSQVVPEPGTYALLCGLLVPGVAYLRRRR